MTSAFKAYDVRGIYNENITEDLAYKIGLSFVNYLDAKTVVVGKDMRSSSDTLSKALIEGLCDAGANVYFLGLSSTDMLYFSSIHLETDGAIMVTASHNPGQYNGFKFTRKNALPIGLESGLDKVKDLIDTNSYKKTKTKGTVKKINLKNEFISFMHEFVDPKKLKPLNVVIDAANAMGGYIMDDLLKDSPLKVTKLYYELDGTFPNHDANPLLEENRVDLVSKVIETKSDLGIGLDGDVDRAFFVDDKGKFCSGDFILGLMAKEVLKQKKGAKIVYDVRCSDYVKDTVEALGGKSYMWKVGHAYAKLYMKEIDADFGGEVSGHYYFKYKDAYFDSGFLTSLIILKYLSDNNESLSSALSDTASYFISGEINSKVNDKDAKLAELKELYTGKAKILEIDGLSIISDSWWANIRKSNTEPYLRLNCEAKTQSEMQDLRDNLLKIIRT